MSTPKFYRFLTSAQVQRLYARHIALAQPLLPEMLDSAINSPVNHKHYSGQTDLFQLAGILARKVILNHAYQDGNKRTALYAADMFLKINGYQLQKTPMGADDVDINGGLANAHVAVAKGEWSSEDLGRYYAGIAKPVTVSEEVTEYGEGAELH